MILKEQIDFYRVCFDSMQLGILICDVDGQIHMGNKPLASIFGYAEEDLTNQNVKQFFSPDTIVHRFLGNYHEPKFHDTHETTGTRSDGSLFAAEITLSTLTFKGNIYLKVLVVDITARKEKELQMTHIKETLEREVQVQNKELAKAVKQLKSSLEREKELNKLKTKFIELTSHEFKTPLSAILSSTELIVKYADRKQNHKRDEHAVKIKNMIYHLNSMLNDLLTLENIESGKISLSYSVFNLNSLIKKIIQTSDSFLKLEQQLIYNHTNDDMIFHDQKIIQIILSNLLNNAIKFSGEGDKIIIQTSINDEFIEFMVKDHGIGIPKLEQDLIFKRFFRASNVLHQPGTGIGLNIVKGYVEGLDGEISFESKENECTKFVVKLPKIQNHE